MDLLTVREAARLLRVSVPTVKRYIYDGVLRSAKLPGGRHRIPREEAERLVAIEPAADRDEESGAEAATRVARLERQVSDLRAELERIGATLEVMASFCGGRRTAGEPASQHAGRRSLHEVLVLGPGCGRCDTLYEMTQRLMDREREPVSVGRVMDVDEIAEYGPVLTPALVVDGTLVLSGRVPTEAGLAEMLAGRVN